MGDVLDVATPPNADEVTTTRSYQQEMLDASLVENIIVAQDTGSGKTHIAVLRMKIECDREPHKVSWFIAPTVALCEQQQDVIKKAIGSVGLIHGGLEPKQWTDPNLWKDVLRKNRVVVSTPQVLLDALSHGYISLGREIGLLIFDEAHHANDDHPMNCIMRNFYFSLPVRQSTRTTSHGPVREERPMILGLTASPIFGGNAAVAFRTLEMNLDSVIRSPRQNRDELEAHVHRPVFKHVLYDSPPPYATCHSASKNMQALKRVVDSMDINRDPYVLALRGQLGRMPPGQDRTRVDQKLSKTIQKQNSFSHKGLRDLLNTSHDICYDLGPWAADWYIQHVVEKALENTSPYNELTTAWQAREKTYLLDHLKRINLTLVSYDHLSIENGISAKLRVLIQTLEEEKDRSESFDEAYSGLVFVTRRDAVLALAAVLEHHPRTSGPESFRIGCLLGSSESAYRTTFLDITRKILREPQAKTLDDFRSGEKDLIIATAVAEEGLDIQACGNVIRWDVPNNMASWAQSRGRARRKRSSFVLMFESGGVDDARIKQFVNLEREMVALYNTDRQAVEVPPPLDVDDVLELREFKVESTGALLTLQAAVSHLNHFCSVLPSTRNGGHLALYDIDPPDLPEGWHSLDPQQQVVPAYRGPYGCTLTLPKDLLPELRVYEVEQIYLSKRLAYQHVAFNAYVALRGYGKLYRFVGWHHEKLSEEEEAAICVRSTYSRLENVEVTYPLLIVEPPLNRANFLLPRSVFNAEPKRFFLLPKYSYFELVSSTECEYSLIIPSILRHLTVAMTVRSLRSTIFPRAPLAGIPSPYLTTAVSAPVAEDVNNYQRLETLGDAVLKFVVAANLLSAYPLWHEGYLTRRKDHAVANSRLAKEAIRRSLFRWIIRTRFSPKRFKPLYLSQPDQPVDADKPADENNDEPVVGGGKTRKEIEELSTKMLADVVESLIGAAYLHGGFDLGISCAQFFGLGLEWNPLAKCVELALSRVQLTDEVSTQLVNVEHMLGYTFKRKLLLVEALTHASYQYDDRTVSYERMEFLGDALLDMVVTDLLYRYPGKKYSPHDMHIRKSAVVNTHFLAYICLGRSLEVDASMPGPGPRGQVIVTPKTTQIYLFQCLQHSSSVLLETQRLTFSRFEKFKDEIEEFLRTGGIFPWAALTRLQAPKVFSDMIESLIGAVYLDSEGNVDTIRQLLRSLGISTCLERLIRDNVDVLHPVSRLSVWAARQQAKIEYDYKDEKGRVICTITVEGREPVSAGALKRGHASQEEARFAAAEKAIAVWAVG
ncbi:hypothetical protein PAXINDRAFT_136464 [Paxillus involutus ATCC 200175]|uniref:P-loop containing nucleoside triphosphate hydrolase protein n=1 Tax=Paxillus involutus ATCC 200175 TaxID=664439 RepID=A0A0C9TRS5_PAXIN|nr:hypothetical protein PAXINDRAFT_136464 [Paxillus involutus ATCC 200175]